jgi:putative ABC transport system permease protein
MGFTAVEKAGRGPILQKSVIGRLEPGVSMDQANAEARALAATVFEELKKTIAPRPAFVMNFGVRSLETEVTGNVARILTLLSIAVGLLLLIACANVANLTLARAAEHRRERAIRAAMGATRFDLIRLTLSESTVLAAGSAAAGIAVAAAALKFFSAYIPADLPNSQAIGIDTSVVAFTIAAAAASAILSGLAAALAPSGALRIEALRDGGRGGSAGRSRHRVLSVLVGAQFALTVILLLGASLAVRSLIRTISTDPGFRKDQAAALTTHLPPSFYAKAAQIRALYLRVASDAEREPGVIAAGVGSELPLGTWEKGTIIGEGSLPSQDGSGPIASQIWVTGHYLEALGVPLRAGRMFDDVEYRENHEVVVINDSLARKLWPEKNAVGRRLRNSRTEWETVVGVVGDVKETALSQEAPPQIYEPHSVVPDRLIEAPTIPFFKTMNLVSRSGNGAATQIRQLTEVVQKADASLAISAATPLGDIVDNSSRSQRVNVFLIACFGGIACVLAVLGVTSVLGYSVTQRTHEIGIRIALGATPSRVSNMVLGRGIVLAATGIATGLVISLALTRFIGTFLYGITPRDPLTFLVVPGVLTGVAAVAAWIPARRAAHVDPMDSLRAGE